VRRGLAQARGAQHTLWNLPSQVTQLGAIGKRGSHARWPDFTQNLQPSRPAVARLLPDRLAAATVPKPPAVGDGHYD
jgi:hypothetical protein